MCSASEISDNFNAFMCLTVKFKISTAENHRLNSKQIIERIKQVYSQDKDDAIARTNGRTDRRSVSNAGATHIFIRTQKIFIRYFYEASRQPASLRSPKPSRLKLGDIMWFNIDFF